MYLLHDVHVVVVVFVLLFLFVVEDYIFLGLLDGGFEDFVWTVDQKSPVIGLSIVEVV